MLLQLITHILLLINTVQCSQSYMIVSYGNTLTFHVKKNSVMYRKIKATIELCFDLANNPNSHCGYNRVYNSSGIFINLPVVSFLDGAQYNIENEDSILVDVIVIESEKLRCSIRNTPLLVEDSGNAITCSLKFSKYINSTQDLVFSDRFTLAGVDLDTTHSVVKHTDYMEIVYQIEIRRFGRQHSHGMFICQVAMKFMDVTEHITCDRNFDLYAPPLLLKIEAVNYTTDAVRFLCRTDGREYPTDMKFTWLLNGRVLRPKLMSSVGDDVLIGHSSFFSQRNLTCVGRNSAGLSSVNFLFNLPVEPTAVSYSNSHAAVTIKIASFLTLLAVIISAILLKYIGKSTTSDHTAVPAKSFAEHQQFIANSPNT